VVPKRLASSAVRSDFEDTYDEYSFGFEDISLIYFPRNDFAFLSNEDLEISTTGGLLTRE
jgi:hypothetical protein